MSAQPTAATGHQCLSTDPFQSHDNQQIFDLIDRLAECGIHKSVGIPQIVIVGDQSSGKSSLLQSLTDIPFPVGDGLCTRFPTKIVSRRGQSGTEKIGVSILEPLCDTKSVGVDAFARTLPSLTSGEFEELIKEASILLGVAQPDEPGFSTSSSKNFSSSTLKVEITGPGRTPFNIIDLPGLFHASTISQRVSEIEEIKNMVNSYIQDSGTIIVGVAHGLANVATQEIFEMAGKIDKDGLRTVGVITKCDLISDTTEILKLAKNQTRPLEKHGWFVVRNRSARELLEADGRGITNEERHSRENSLFSTAPWTQLPDAHRGVHSLQDYLSNLLLQHSRSKLPEIEQEIQSLISKRQSELNALGHSRDTELGQRQFLQEVARNFQAAAENALSGHYSSNILLKDNRLKLRKRIIEANEKFASDMLTRGHAVEFKVVEELPLTTKLSFPTAEKKPEPSIFAKSSPANPQPKGVFFGGTAAPAPEKKAFALFSAAAPLQAPESVAGFGAPLDKNVFGSSLRGEPGEAPAAPSTIKFPPRTAEVRVEESNSKIRLQWLFPENLHWSFEEIRLVDYLQLSKETKKTTLSSTPPIDSEIDNWIREEIANNRGTELPGIPNPEVIPALFRRQTRDWASYAQQHAQAIRSIIQDSTKVLLSAICEDNAVRLNLEAKLSLFNLQAIRESEPELDSLIQDLREKPLQTYNPLFGKKIEQARRLRFNNALSRYLQQTGQLGNIYGGRMVDLDPSHLFDELHISKSRNLADDIHDTLKAYYDLEVVEFVGAVNSHITERYVTSPKGPARGFSPSWVGELPKEQLAELASESGEVIAKRKEIEGLLERLRLAEKILAEHKQGKVVQ